MAKVIGRDMSSEMGSRYRDPDEADYEMDQDQPGAVPADYESQARGAVAGSEADYPNDSGAARYDLQIQAIFKRSRAGGSSVAGTVYGMPSTTLKRGPMTLIIPTKHLECRCPKIKVNR